MNRSFDPVAGKDARILILGSFPGVASLEKQQYYGHGRNQFWPLLAQLLDVPLPDDYDRRLAMLLAYRIALWDVLFSCQRQGSLDARIRDPKPNDLEGFLRKYQDIGHVFLNGASAEKLFERFFGHLTIARTRLPSTSPAHAVSLSKKRDAWQAVLQPLSPRSRE